MSATDVRDGAAASAHQLSPAAVRHLKVENERLVAENERLRRYVSRVVELVGDVQEFEERHERLVGALRAFADSR